MNSIRPIFILIVLLLLFESCGDAVQCDCIGEDPNIYIRIVDKDSKDLVFGENSIYSADSILAYTVFSKYTINHTIEPFFVNGGEQDSVLVLENPDFLLSKVIIDYGNSDVDTLTISFETIETECCGIFRRVNNVLLNGEETNNGFITILKR